MNLYSLIVLVLAIAIQSTLSADDEQFNSLEESKANSKLDQMVSDKRSPSRQNPASRQAAFGKRFDINDKLEFYGLGRMVRGTWPPPASSRTAFGKRNDADKGKRRKFGVPSSRLSYFGKREDEPDNESWNNATEDEINSINALLENLMKVYDLNGDGVISKDEFFVVHAFLMQLP
ncbi:uncharacterized protein LOC144359441 [Saccoglossus kowalevskii]